jgi:hypothetical protein
VSTTGTPERLEVVVTARAVVPAYAMRGYTLRAVAYGHGNIPLERVERKLPDLKPGANASSVVSFTEKPLRVVIDVLRPTGFSAATHVLST